ncbi:MAG: two-component sensor histidine kinase [Mailhella sp.]|nr:two-component sensor histidine kinase [Mailhella sp.]
MVHRIFRSILSAAIVTLLACLVIITGILYRHSAEEQHTQLGNQLVLAVSAVEKNGLDYLASLKLRDSRITWIASDGAVLFDSEADVSAMENHADREEVKQALASGTGKSTRQSATLLEETLYLARRLEDGSVLRMSVTTDTALSLALGMIQPIALVALIGIFFSGFLAQRMARRIVEPFNRLDLDRPLENDTYEELSPLLKRIEHQHRQIDLQLTDLTRRTEEFALITNAMKEGLVLLDASRNILSINLAARALFNVTGDCLGRNILLIDRSCELQEAMLEARKKGVHQTRLMRYGREFQFDITSIGPKGRTEGFVLLAVDVTEQAENERRRREFSANVSHELKTPLQTIIGSAELLEHGLVPQQDTARFAGNIRREALRLVALIEDIIHLSRLEEGMEIPSSDFDVLDLLSEVALDFHDAAASRSITLSVEGESGKLHSVRPLLKEIVSNLCDNAIKYNVDGGTVRMALLRKDGKLVITVADSGIGIHQEDQERIFERFYRVDKSHSKATGGTGLGLSIVKHAAQRIGAEITVESEPGRGATFQISFPITL